ncbi:hypothetical protein MATL_G00175310 [Megalops atlanticus]|uniref:Ig-like domain-containing protein n=1 Tax=Megalops atlanticus TaxID=7932 RepID=A0A9D3T1R6_MEGAT|nr:hypothetical protein MATL_G00175310 [Megalops atlanticus]
MTWYCVLILCFCRMLVADNDVSQPRLSVTAQLGDNVTLECFKLSGSFTFFWFKKTEGERPICMVTGDYPSKITAHGGFHNNPRFNWTFSDHSFNLRISSIEPSDVATYFCAVYYWSTISFGNGTLLTLKGTVDPAKKTEPSDTGHKTNNLLVPTVFGLGAALAVCVIVIFALVCTRNKNTRCDHCKGNMNRDVSSDCRSSVMSCDAETLNYAALSFSDKKRKNQRKKREMERDTLYSQVRYQTYD